MEEIPETIMRKHLGGGALAAYVLLREMPAGVDPLGPDNVLVFMTSVINGLSLSGSNRYTAAAKSPLTGAFGESEAGGWWGPEPRAAGWDGVVTRGASATPVYLWIKDGEVEFRDASAYWGKLSGEVQDGLEQDLYVGPRMNPSASRSPWPTDKALYVAIYALALAAKPPAEIGAKIQG